MLTGRSRVLCVWGYPVRHSRSPAMQNAALARLGLDMIYVPFEVNPDSLPDAVAGVRALGIGGVNLTIPHKETVGPLLDDIEPEAMRSGSVNTIVVENERLVGASTDGPGLIWDLRRHDVDPAGKTVMLWGAGGSARGIAFAFADLGCTVWIANRSKGRADRLCEDVGPQARSIDIESRELRDCQASADLLVNTTSLGMAGPQSDKMPVVHGDALNSRQLVYDLVYTPPETRLMSFCAAAGCKVLNGLGMLVCQGALSLSRWTDVPVAEIPLDVMDRAVKL